MDRNEIIQRLRSLALDSCEYWVITGSAMVLHGLRPETHDSDLGCTSALADRLAREGYPTKTRADGTRKITIGEDIELFENWLCGNIEAIEGIPVLSLEGLMEMKRSLGREKDQRDIALIEARLQSK